MELAGKTALVTGAARRVGKAISLELAAQGASVVVHYCGSKSAAEETVDEIAALGVSAWPIQADLRSPSAVGRLFDRIEELSPGLSVLVNSAASFESEPFLEIGAAEWDEVQALNLRAPFLCTQRATPMIRAAGGGAVINIADLSGLKPWKKFAHHGTSKAGLVHLTRAAAHELAPEVRVNCVVPGAILAPAGVAESGESWQKRGDAVPLRRTGTENEVAAAVVFLACHEFITGAVLPVDGGEHLTAPRGVL